MQAFLLKSKCDGIRTQPRVRLRRLLSLQTFRRVLPSAVLPTHHATCHRRLQSPMSSLKTVIIFRNIVASLNLFLVEYLEQHFPLGFL